MVRGVLFDFHNTLVTAGSLTSWLQQADVAPDRAAGLEPVLTSVWSRAAARYPGSTWDLDPARHRAVFVEVLRADGDCPEEIAARLYGLMPAQWQPVDGAADMLAELRARGVRTALVSNIAMDPRQRLRQMGLLDNLDEVLLSYEEGLVKPDPAFFHLAAERLGVPCEECLMVGDSPGTDGGAVNAGMAAVLVPVVSGRPDLTLVRDLLLG